MKDRRWGENDNVRQRTLTNQKEKQIMRHDAVPEPNMNQESQGTPETSGEKIDKTPPSCESCGRPATRVANLSIDVHLLDAVGDEGYYDGDSLVELRDIRLCDDCDVCWDDIPHEEIERIGAHFGGMPNEDVLAEEEEER